MFKEYKRKRATAKGLLATWKPRLQSSSGPKAGITQHSTGQYDLEKPSGTEKWAFQVLETEKASTEVSAEQSDLRGEKPLGWDREENIFRFEVQGLSEDSEGKEDYSRNTVQHVSEEEI